MKMPNFNKKLLIIPIILLLLIAVPITVYLVQQQTKSKSSANAATTLAFDPAAKTVAKDTAFDLDVKVNPTTGDTTNLVTQVTLLISYDPTKLEVTGDKFVVNPEAFPTVNHGPVYGNGTISVTVSNLSCQSCIVQKLASVGTVSFKAIAATGDNTPTEVAFVTTGTDKTEVRASSATGTSSITENVLASTAPAKIIVTGGAPVCPVDNATCSWDAASGATSYHYKVTSSDGAVVKEGDVPTANDGVPVTVDFNSEAGKTYTCVVTPSNICGVGPSGQATATCKAPPVTPLTCNSSCTSTSQCDTGLVCTGDTTTPGFCRKAACQNATDCTCATPPAACNATCTTNADCSSNDCYYANTDDTSGLCRNTACETASSCTCPVPTNTPTPTPVPVSNCPYTCQSSDTCTADNSQQPVSGYTCVDTGTVCCKDIVPTDTPAPVVEQQPIPTATPIVYAPINTPTPMPTLLPTGPGTSIVKVGTIGLILSIIGGFLLLAF